MTFLLLHDMTLCSSLVQEEDVVKLCDTQPFHFLCKVNEILLVILLKEITETRNNVYL